MSVKTIRVFKDSSAKELSGTINYHLGRGNTCELTAVGIPSLIIAIKTLSLLTSMYRLKYSAYVDYFHFTSGGKSYTGHKFIVENRRNQNVQKD